MIETLLALAPSPSPKTTPLPMDRTTFEFMVGTLLLGGIVIWILVAIGRRNRMSS